MKKCMMRAGFFLLCILWLSQAVLAAELVPVGEVIGIELSDGTVTVAAFDKELGADAQTAGLQVGDRITKIDKTDVATIADVRTALERSNGTVTLEVLRKGEKQAFTVRPQVTQDGPKLGLYLKQGMTGIGTVTWYDPETGSFGALGHGVNAADGALVRMRQGKVYRAAVLSVKKGAPGEPGQLMGSLEGELPIGSLTKNTERGIFGTVQAGWQGEPLPTCGAGEVRTGAATILSTVQGQQVREYSVEILKIYPNAGTAGRNLLLKVTDPALLESTGGIVQGMGVIDNMDNTQKPVNTGFPQLP